MSKNPPPRLKLHVEEQALAASPAGGDRLAALLCAFQRATGWELAVERSPAGCGEVWSTELEGDGFERVRLIVRPAAEERTDGALALPFTEVRPLARSIADFLNENSHLRRQLRQREAELAAGVPVAPRRDEEQHLATRLESVLRAGAEAVGCQAAGLYLLNDATSELKLRAAWGLAGERLLEPARPLRGAVADLEALTGHAVVLEDTSLLPHWKCPESFAAAACVPVSSPSVPLGTLWVFCDQQRDFSEQETNLLEIIAGRLAADLEREILLSSGQAAKERDKELAAGARWLCDRLPSVAPLMDDYTVAGWTRLAGEVGGSFHDWTVLNDGRLALLVGDASGSPIEASLTAASVRGLAAAHAEYCSGVGDLFSKINASVAASSPGGERASLAYALIDPACGAVEFALAGKTMALVVGRGERVLTTTDAPPIGEMAEFDYPEDALRLKPGESLVLLSSGVQAAVDAAGLAIGQAALATWLARQAGESADGLATRLRRFLDHPGQLPKDMSVAIVTRRTL